MPKYGDMVLYVKDGKKLNALVLQAQDQPDGCHCTLVFLDPAFDSPILGGSAAARAVATVFATPIGEGKAQGWTNAETSDDGGFVASLMPHLIALSGEVAKVDPKADISPDGTLQSAAKIISEIPEMRMNFGDAQAKNDSEWEKQIKALHEQLKEAKVIAIGKDKVPGAVGTHNDVPAVIFESGPSAVILEFHDAESTQVLIEDLAAMYPGGGPTPGSAPSASD